MKILSFIGSICFVSVSLFAANTPSPCEWPPEYADFIKNKSNEIWERASKDARLFLGREPNFNDPTDKAFVRLLVREYIRKADTYVCPPDDQCFYLDDLVFERCIDEKMK